MATVKADPKAIAARRNQPGNTAATRAAQAEAQKQRQRQQQGQAWRKDHGLA